MPVLEELPSYSRLPEAAVAAEGCELVLADGRRLLDLYGGHCVNTLGAGDPWLRAAIERQWKALSFATNLVDNPTRAPFLAAFEALLPDGTWRVFLSNSGAEANENALKAACAATGRGAVVAFEGAFHGRTAAAEAVTDTKRRGFPQTPFEVRRLPFGAAQLDAIDAQVAAVILEPIQSMAGVVTPPDGWLAALRARCDEVGALLVFDEVQTGSGRLGSFFASQHFGVVPDALTTAKGAAGGLPIGVTVLSAAVAARLDPGLFGSTFGGGPTVLAAATELPKRPPSPGFLENVRAASAALVAAAKRGPVVNVRGAGLLLGLELADGVSAVEVRDGLLERGVLVGTSADPGVLRLSPPLNLAPEDARRLHAAFAALEGVRA